jgi:uncharacterized protein
MSINSGSNLSSLPELGVGLVYWSELEPLLQSREGLISVIEIEPQSFWYELDRDRNSYLIDAEMMQRLCSLPQPKLIHSVGIPVGATRSPIDRQGDLLRKMLSSLNSPWMSEHLSFNRAKIGVNEASFTGFLLPPLQTFAGVDVAVESIRTLVDILSVPFAFETGVNYLRPRIGELKDGEFVNLIATESDCGILLDLHNLWTNERNGRQSVEEFLSQIPLERVIEVHLAGGFEHHGFWLDAHSGEVPEPLWSLAKAIIPRLPNLKALIFEVMPMFLPRLGLDKVRQQLEKLHKLWDLRNPCVAFDIDRLYSSTRDSLQLPDLNIPIEHWENTLGNLAVGKSDDYALFNELQADPGVEIIRSIVESVRSGMVADALKLSVTLIIISQGDLFLQELLKDFWRSKPLEMFGDAEGLGFANYLEKCDLNIKYFTEILAFEKAQLSSIRTGSLSIIKFPYNPIPLFESLLNGKLPVEELIPEKCEIKISSEQCILQ